MGRHTRSRSSRRRWFLTSLGAITALLGVSVGLPASADSPHADAAVRSIDTSDPGLWSGESVEPDEVDLLAASALSEEFKVDDNEALRRIMNQDYFDYLYDEMAIVLGDDQLSGGWIDQRNGGQFHINVVDEAALVAEALLAGAGRDVLLGIAKYSINDLRGIARDAEATLSENGMVPSRFLLDAPFNSLRVQFAGPAPASADALMEEMSHLLLKFEFGTGEPVDFACIGWLMICDPPVRGGIEINDATRPAYSCTVGFVVKSKVDSKKFSMTAGHCFGSSPTDWWISGDPDFNNFVLGEQHPNRVYNDSEGDVGLIRFNSTHGVSPPNDTRVLVKPIASPGTNPSSNWYDITGVSLSGGLQGAYLCKSGSFSRSECSRVYGTDIEGNFVWSEITDTAVSVCAGDSGGPVFKNNKGFGIVEGGFPTGQETRPTYFDGTTTRVCTGTTGWWRYMSLTVALNRTNTKIIP